MSYRINKSYDESSSDEDGPSHRKERKLDGNDDPMQQSRAGSKAAQMWTDLLADQSLSETFSGTVGVYGGDRDMVERGVESYTLPDVRPVTDDREMSCKNREIVSSGDGNDEPFDFVADEENVGNSSNKLQDKERSRRNESRSRNRNRRNSGNSINQRKNMKQWWKHSASTSRSTSGGDREPQRNNNHPNKGNNKHNARNMGNRSNILKRRRGNQNRNFALSDDYSLEVLMTTEFPQNIEIEELAVRISKVLGERDGRFLQRAIIEIGEEKSLELFEATREVEATGGMMVADGTRRRTPGGVFMTLFKTDPDILPVLKEKVCNIQKAAAREIRSAKRRQKREAAETFADALKKVEAQKKLPEAPEVLLAEKQEQNLMDIAVNDT